MNEANSLKEGHYDRDFVDEVADTSRLNAAGERSPVKGKLPILVADDDVEDCVLLREAFSRCGLDVDLRFVPDGQALLDYLRREGTYAQNSSREVPLPAIILLDLNMPRKNGRRALEEIRADDELCRMPVIVFTTSAATEDVDSSYKLGANSFITKPVRFSDLVKVVEVLNEYWFRTVTVSGDKGT